MDAAAAAAAGRAHGSLNYDLPFGLLINIHAHAKPYIHFLSNARERRSVGRPQKKQRVHGTYVDKHIPYI